MGSYTGGSDRTEAMTDDINEMLGNTPDPAPEEIEYEEPDPTTEEATPQAEPEGPAPLRIGEAEYDPTMAEDINNLVQWASSLTPEQYQKLNEALYGQPEAAPTPPPAPEPEPEPEIDYSEVDPDTAAVLKRQAEELAALKAQLAETGQSTAQIQQALNSQQLEQQRAEFAAAEAQVKGEVMEQYSFGEDDYNALVATAGQLGITYPYIQQYGPVEGMRKVLETAMYANPQMQERVINAQAQELARQQLNESRKEAAAALNPQGGTNIPDQNPVNLPVSEKRKAMIADIDAMLGNQ